MRPEMANIFSCPYCGSQLEARPIKVVKINYPSEKLAHTEIKEGTLQCKTCGAIFKIKNHIPSFTHPDIVHSAVVRDGIYWGRYYRTLYEYGILNFVDIRQPFAPFYRYGILNKLSWQERMEFKKLNMKNMSILQNDEFDMLINNKIIDENLSKGSNVLEIGCGSGWLCLELKRKGFNVIGLDPSFQSLKIAKQYAISKGFYIEYVQADATLPIFQSGIFEGVFAFHSLHHVRNLHQVTLNIKKWLKKGGLISLYEHRYDSSLLQTAKRLGYLAFFPWLLARYKHSGKLLSSFMALAIEKSPMEDASIDMINDITKSFYTFRRILHLRILDDVPCLIYFIFQRNKHLLENCAKIIDSLQGRFKTLFPQKTNFVLYVGLETKNSKYVASPT